jgi:hypothetical protein
LTVKRETLFSNSKMTVKNKRFSLANFQTNSNILHPKRDFFPAAAAQREERKTEEFSASTKK